MSISLQRLINRLERMHKEYGDDVIVKVSEDGEYLVLTSTEGDFQDSIDLTD